MVERATWAVETSEHHKAKQAAWLQTESAIPCESVFAEDRYAGS